LTLIEIDGTPLMFFETSVKHKVLSEGSTLRNAKHSEQKGIL
jgi:hypothetical protein